MKLRKGMDLSCAVCAKPFYVKPSHVHLRRTCSRKCAAQAMRRGNSRYCQNCGEVYYRPPSQAKWRGSTCCSDKCKFEFAKKTGRNRGIHNGNWRGGKIKITALDKKFSKFIRYRDNFTCQRCGTSYTPGAMGLHNSHFIGRKNWAVRFDPENCDAACYGCHMYWEANRVTDYRDWKIAQLGRARYDALVKRSRQITKRSKIDRSRLTEEISARLYEEKERYEVEEA